MEGVVKETDKLKYSVGDWVIINSTDVPVRIIGIDTSRQTPYKISSLEIIKDVTGWVGDSGIVRYVGRGELKDEHYEKELLFKYFHLIENRLQRETAKKYSEIKNKKFHNRQLKNKVLSSFVSESIDDEIFDTKEDLLNAAKVVKYYNDD